MAAVTTALPAIAGGPPVRTQPLPTISDARGRDLGDEELAQLTEVIRAGKLNRNDGTKVKALQAAWAEQYGVRFATASTSGTAAIHVALGALPLAPGDEVLTSPITDFGTVAPILAQNCVPVFADLDPRTYCLDPAAVERAITPRTRAIIAVHLMGHPCDMDAMLAIAKRHKLYLIEDCAQAHFATWRGRLVGTMGDLGTFSLQQSKQITCGDGGMTITDDPELGERIAFFADKGDDRREGRRDPRMFGLNYRMTELQGAVMLAQLAKADRLVGHRRRVAALIDAGIADAPGVSPPYVAPQAVSSYWYYMISVDPGVLGVRGAEFARALEAEGVNASVRGGRPIHLREMFQRQRAFGNGHFPWDYGDRRLEDVDYSPGSCPVAEEFGDPQRTTAIQLPCNEGITDTDAHDIIQAIQKVAGYYAAQHSRTA